MMVYLHRVDLLNSPESVPIEIQITSLVADVFKNSKSINALSKERRLSTYIKSMHQLICISTEYLSLWKGQIPSWVINLLFFSDCLFFYFSHLFSLRSYFIIFCQGENEDWGWGVWAKLMWFHWLVKYHNFPSTTTI